MNINALNANNRSINFNGAFLVKNTSLETWNLMKATFPKKKCAIPNLNSNGDRFIAVKDCYDILIADFINKNKDIKFEYFPNINLKSMLDPEKPKEAESFIRAQTNVIKTRTQMMNYIRKVRKQFMIPDQYYWKPGDHIEQTMKALGLNTDQYRTYDKNGITFIKDKTTKKVIAKASPNSNNGINYVYVNSGVNGNPSSRKLAIDHTGKIIWEYSVIDIKSFKDNFLRAINIDEERKQLNKKRKLS